LTVFFCQSLNPIAFRAKCVTKELTFDELLEKAKKPAELVLTYHPLYEGKM